MAYMNQEMKKVIAEQVKPILKQYGLKGSLSVRNYSTITLTIKEGSIDFLGNYMKNTGRENVDYLSSIVYWSAEKFDGVALEVIKKLTDALKSAGWYDRSDAMTDYFDTAYYYGIDIGTWEKPYNLVKA
jgi:hypothetical protein